MQLFPHSVDGAIDVLRTRPLASFEQFEVCIYDGSIIQASVRMIDRTGNVGDWRNITLHESSYAALVFAVGDHYASERESMAA